MYKKYEIMKIVFEKSSELIFILRENGDIFGANPLAKEASGYGEDIYSMNIIDIFPTVFIKEQNQVILTDEDLRGPEEIKNLETVAYCDNQTCFPVLLNYNKIAIDGDIIGICHAVNISERKAAIKKQKKALVEVTEVTKVKNEFMANVTHELRTPLNGIKGILSNLTDTALTAEQSDLVRIILQCCNNMTKIINDILDVSKIEAGKMKIEKQEFDFNNFLKELINFNSNIISEKGLKFLVNIGKGIPVRLIGDELRLGQIVNNFLANAIKFTTVGSISLEVVKTFETESEIELFFLIIDTGIGIAKEDMDRLFIPFSQVDGSITRRFGGTGLGLSICKQLVEDMGGSIQVESELGRGSTFSFTVKLEMPENSKGNLKRIPIDDYYKSKHDNKDNYKSYDEILIENLEKLIISIEMGTWDRAEMIASVVKKLMSEDNKELSRAAFRVVLSVRKCDYDKSIQGIRELQEMLGIT